MKFGKAKISLIGGGQIGGVLSQLIAFRELGDVVMYDVVEDLPQGKCLDIAEAANVDGFDVSITGTNNYKDIEGTDLFIVTAGLPRKPGMSRDDLLITNADIIKVVAEKIKKYAPESYVLVLSNPLDAMVTVMKEITGFPINRVFGQSGVLDSSRFATFIAWELGISVKEVSALVLGGHGDTMVPIIRLANVNGIPVMELLEKKYASKSKAKEVISAIVERTKQAGGEIVSLLKKGSAFYSPAASAVAMVESIIKDQKRVMPTCAFLNGEYGINGYYMGVPAVIGAKGVERIIEFEMNEDEKQMLNNSVNSVKKLVEDLKRLKYL